MRCPFCSNQDSQVKDSRPTEDNTAIRRRRICDQCGSRFTTFERIQLRDLIVLKTNGKKEVFDRDKMFRSLSLALRKRNVDQEKIEKIEKEKFHSHKMTIKVKEFCDFYKKFESKNSNSVLILNEEETDWDDFFSTYDEDIIKALPKFIQLRYRSIGNTFEEFINADLMVILSYNPNLESFITLS